MMRVSLHVPIWGMQRGRLQLHRMQRGAAYSCSSFLHRDCSCEPRITTGMMQRGSAYSRSGFLHRDCSRTPYSRSRDSP